MQREQLEFQRKLQQTMRENNLDAVILTKQESVFYATGYASKFLFLMQQPGVTYAVVPKTGKCQLVLSDFEKQTAQVQCKDVEIRNYSSWIFIDDDGAEAEKEKTTQMNMNQSYDIGTEIIKGINPKPRVGVEKDWLTWSYYEKLGATFGKENLVDFTPLFTETRKIKTAWEIEMLRESARIAEKAIKMTAGELQPGMTEFDLLAIYQKNAYAVNKDIVGTLMVNSIGPNYSPSFIARNYALKKGDIVRLDGGVNYFGYRSDIARTFVIGAEPTAKQDEKFHAILAGYKKALAMIRPGVKFAPVFEAAQRAVREAGIPQYIRGHFGHSIGVDSFVEEAPFISPKTEEVFTPGMVMCIECPYYSYTMGGFNIEDTFAVTEDGIEMFTATNETLVWPR